MWGRQNLCLSSYVIAAEAAIHGGCRGAHARSWARAIPGHFPDVGGGSIGQSLPMKRPCVYILASERDGILYVGVTSDLWQRMAQHTQGLVEGFTSKHGVKQLVYYEFHQTMDQAIEREKQLKHWERAWKVRLIHEANRVWCNLYDANTGEVGELPQARDLVER